MSTRLEGVDALRNATGLALGHSDWVALPQEAVDDFSRLTFDDNWLHTDPVRAAAGPFGGTIVHGYFTLCLTPFLLQQLLEVSDAGTPVNYGCNRVRFPSPLPVGTPVRMTATIEAVEPVSGGIQLVLDVSFEAEGVIKPVCVAEVVIRYLR